jgi:hypothetical protein
MSRMTRRRALSSVTVDGVPELISKLIPMLHVKDPDEERRFYEQLVVCRSNGWSSRATCAISVDLAAERRQLEPGGDKRR